MNLLEILSQKKLQKQNQIKEIKETKETKEVEKETKEVEVKKEDNEISYFTNSILKKPNYTLFLATYAPYIREPYKFDWFHFRDYRDFLLGDTGYVLNTFTRIDGDALFLKYLGILKPMKLREYSILAHFCHHVSLCVPIEYKEDILKIMDSIGKIKN